MRIIRENKVDGNHMIQVITEQIKNSTVSKQVSDGIGQKARGRKSRLCSGFPLETAVSEVSRVPHSSSAESQGVSAMMRAGYYHCGKFGLHKKKDRRFLCSSHQ